jgi:hypothetical protein
LTSKKGGEVRDTVGKILSVRLLLYHKKKKKDRKNLGKPEKNGWM